MASGAARSTGEEKRRGYFFFDAIGREVPYLFFLLLIYGQRIKEYTSPQGQNETTE
jgi:hypothetical protein